MSNTERQLSAEWFEKRIGRITGSRVGAILGESPFSTGDNVMREMVREHHGAEREFTGNIATDWGREHEKTAKLAYEELKDCFVEATGFHPFETKNCVMLGASPDGLVGEDGLIEIKCPFSKKIKSIEEQKHYWHQIQLELYSTGRDWCDYVCWTPDDILVERVNVDNGWIEKYGEELAAFYREYKSIIESKELSAPFLEDKEIDKSSDIDWCKAEAKYLAAVQAESEAKAKTTEAKAELLALADGKKCFSDSVTVFKTVKKGSISYQKALKSVAPDADLEEYRGNPSEYWTIKVKG